MSRAVWLLAAAWLALAPAWAGEYFGRQKVVYHINYDDPAAQAGALRNLQNHINAVGKENLDLKVVLHGKGLSLLLEPDAAAETRLPRGNATEEIEAKISVLKAQGVRFKVCANTLLESLKNPSMDFSDTPDKNAIFVGLRQIDHST